MVRDIIFFSKSKTFNAKIAKKQKFGGIIWEAPDNSLNALIDKLLSCCEPVAAQALPLDKIHPMPPKEVNAVQVCILTPGGIHHGIGTFSGGAKNATGAPIIEGASLLMRALIDKNAANKKQ